MSDEYKIRYIVIVLPYPHPGSIGPTRDHHTLVPTELIKDSEVKRANINLPKTYRRSTTETIMYPIGQNILLIYPHIGIELANFLDSGTGFWEFNYAGEACEARVY